MGSRRSGYRTSRQLMASVSVVGLGPAGLDRTSQEARTILEDPDVKVILRTERHPAARELAALRDVEFCDELYNSAAEIEHVYRAIAQRVLAAAAIGPVAYAVPGSPGLGERSVALLVEGAAEAALPLELIEGESFLSLAMHRAGVDALARGLQVLDAHGLPEPLLLHLPTLIGHVDRTTIAADLALALSKTLLPATPITVMQRLGSPDEAVRTIDLGELATTAVDERTTLFLDPPAVGWPGLVQTNLLLRAECPWDRVQTHHSLVEHLIEESYELVEALAGLSTDAPAGDPDFAAYAHVEEELGDLLLQVVFHATLANEAVGLSTEEVAEGIRRKLVDRHPHVFGDVDAPDADHVRRNWDAAKQVEKGRHSILDGVPKAMPALSRSAKLQRRAAGVGFDWPDVTGAVAKVAEEARELAEISDDPGRVVHETGDLLFSLVNVARHLDVDPELALKMASDRFEARFREMEAEGPLAGLSLTELDQRWERAKGSTG
ncbi:MAG: nucleoside triphosphate pyrophosphohydrolase [Acidimicrobiia bacterium]|nr:nucleoside triphosphate pyrophosphohydrolase [Acidimicrobiia bacterium]